MKLEFGTLTKVDPRALAGGDKAALTSWLGDHLDLLGAVLGMDLELVSRDRAVGAAAADLIARDTGRDRVVIIENQLDPTDDSQLGQIITFASGQDARVVVWISPEFREAHRQALEWLNRRGGQAEFYALGFDVFRIDDSKPAVEFRLLSGFGPHAAAGHTVPLVAGTNGAGGNGSSGASGPAGVNDAGNGNGGNGNGSAIASANGVAANANGQSHDAANGAAPARPTADADHQEAYRQFFQRMVDELREKYRFTNAKMGQPQNWYSFASGTSGVVYSIWFSGGGRVRAELYMDVGNRDLNRLIFDQLRQHSSGIEKEFGEKLEWDAAESRRACSVGTYLSGKIDDSPEILDAILKWSIDRLLRFKKVFGPRLPGITRVLQQEAR
jgi:uncharacterized protein DUF4268